jgi:SAM-dependent methyltransferase
MTAQARRDAIYPLNDSDEAYQFLIEQAGLFRPFTEQLFVEAGIRPGMRVLDVGSGVGDVALLAADLVGPEGAVVGVDTDPNALRLARGRTADRGNVTFVESDLREAAFDAPFDAAVGRFVLEYLADPAAAIRHLAGHVRPGGIIALQEVHYECMPSLAWPRLPLYERLIEQAVEMMHRIGGEVQMGLKLYAAFVGAGLPGPALRMDTCIGGGPDFTGYDYIASGVRGLLPAIERVGVATAAELDVDTLADRLRTEVVAGNGVISLPPLVGAWARKPADQPAG